MKVVRDARLCMSVAWTYSLQTLTFEDADSSITLLRLRRNAFASQEMLAFAGLVSY